MSFTSGNAVAITLLPIATLLVRRLAGENTAAIAAAFYVLH
jgi:di/tricarboxylate transporter